MRTPKLSNVLVCVFREVRGFIEVWIVNEHRVTILRSDLVELVGLITCVEGGLGQIAKLLVLVRRCACPALLGQVRKERVDVKVRIGLEVTVKEQQGWVRHETEESERERNDTYAKNPFGHP